MTSVLVVAVAFLALQSLEERAKAGEPMTEGQKPLEINGQNRNLNMMLVLRNDKDKIKFVKMRENYHDEIMEKSPAQKNEKKE